MLGVMTITQETNADTLLVSLTVEEEAGVPRHDEPVTMGIPLPEGKVENASMLKLTDESGKLVPCQFSEVARWYTPKGGLKWVHADFQVSLKAGAKKTLQLWHTETPQPTPRTSLKATKKDGVVTVVTGPLKFRVRGSRFNGFDGVWLDPSGKGRFDESTMIVPPGGKGGSFVRADGETCSSLHDDKGTVEIETAGPMKVVVKAVGTHRNKEGKRVFDYIVRFYAYAGSPVVRVQHTFVNRQGRRPADRFLMKDLAFLVPTTASGGVVTVGTDTAPRTADLGRSGRILALQKTSDELLVFRGKDVWLRGKGKSTKPLSSGWINIGGKNGSVACGVRWFWQMFPKSIGVLDGGTLRVGLYAEEAGSDLEVFMGQSRTHDLTFLFHKGMSANELNDFFIASQKPLRAWAAPEYYCRIARPFGPIAESRKELFGKYWDDVTSHDRKMLSSIRRILKNLDGEKRNGHVHESYGFYPWGDSYHWYWPKRQNSPNDRPEWHLAWAGNYYDFPNACLLQFLRTGEKTYLERFEPCARHVGDVFICHYHPKKSLWGACRYCPPRNHVATDDGRPYVSVEFNHAKSQCVFNHYYLFGDLRSLDNAKLLANNALNNHAADTGWAPRGLGAHIAQLWCAYELWGEKKYLDRIKDMVRRGLPQVRRGKFRKGGKFMYGIAYEGMVYAWWVTRDPAIVDALKAAYDVRIKNNSRGYTNMALGAAFVYAMTGEEKYRDFAWKCIRRGKATPRPKSFGLQWRNTAYALFYLSNAAKTMEKGR